jgi:hypothetical protein
MAIGPKMLMGWVPVFVFVQREFRLAMKAQAKRKKPRADLIDVDLIKGTPVISFWAAARL